MKTNLRNLITMALSVAMISSTVAFANVPNAIEIEVPDPATIDLMVDMPAMNPEVVAPLDGGVIMPAIGGGDDGIALISEGFVAPAFISQTGTIGDITANEDGSFEVFLEDETGGLRFMLSPETRIIDRETNEYTFVEDVTVGMVVTVVYSSTTPVGMSLPPFIGQITALVVNADVAPVAVGAFNEELFSEQAGLQLNIDEENLTMVHLSGARMPVMIDDLKNNGNAIVFYGMTTRSIPPQTTPTHIFFLQDEVMLETGAELGLAPLGASSSVEGDILDETTGLPVGWTPADGARGVVADSEAEFVPVRSTAEALGYNVNWRGADQSILVTKDGIEIEINIGSAVYLRNGVEISAPKTAENVNGTLFASINF